MPIDPNRTERRFAELLEEAGLPRFTSAQHDVATDYLEVSWDHGFTIYIDLTRDDMEPIDESERAAILGLPHVCEDHGPIHVFAPGSADDPRLDTSIPGVVIHRGPALHPDDLTVYNGIPVTTPSRTLIDCAEGATIDELRALFARARALGHLDPEALRAARGRVEWRPSLAMLDQVIEEFCA
jgi:hypothetical protein